MNIEELKNDFNLRIEHHPPLNYLRIDHELMVINDEELENLEYGLTNFLHAIAIYKRSRKESAE